MQDRLLIDLQLVREAIPSTLVDEQGYQRLAVVAENLPVALTTFWGLECRLGEEVAAADILCEIKNGFLGQKLLAGSIPSTVDRLCERWPAWQNLRNMAQLWTEQTHIFNTGIRNIWLEFDTAALSAADDVIQLIGNPCIFFGPKPLSQAQLIQIIQEVLVVLGRQDLLTNGNRNFISTIPDEVHLFQIGLMMGRQEQGLRVCINGPPPEAIAGMLDHLQWQGNINSMAQTIKKLSFLVQAMAICLDVVDGKAVEKIGIECYMDWSLEKSEQWIPLLDFMEDANLCICKKRRGLLAFPGITITPFDERLYADGMINLNLFRRIHHVKISAAHDRLVEAKAYLALARPRVSLNHRASNCANAEFSGHDSWYVG